ncbi:alpha/beta fold hydrolase [Lysobacter soli]|uniref:Alpha/beta hydrolase n=1 Tax=Lysobacter soli TaxID=453783 RepID=A0A3D8VGD9_9GAMM|nr:alpha/beta hydrolase [Lysobacter soli]RDY68385.1 alpha/beta hydrolase [Lysobacter soli]
MHRSPSTVRALFAVVLLSSLALVEAAADVRPYPSSFREREMAVTDGTQHVRIGGKGPAVVLLHGFGDTGDMWEPLASVLVKDHTVIVPDLRGMGLSSHPETGYEKAAQARDLAAMLDQLKVKKVQLVTHDIGNMVGYALATRYPDRVTSWVVMDAPLPGMGTWEAQLVNPRVWHFNFRGPDVERLVAGRERILLDRFYNDLGGDPSRIDEATRQHYAELYARPGAIHNAFGGQFEAFSRDAEENKATFAKAGKLTIPVLAIGGDKSYGANMKTELEYVATNVDGAVIENSGHWIMEEQPQQALDVILPFLASH